MSTIVEPDIDYFIVRKKLEQQSAFFNEYLKNRVNFKQETVNLSTVKTPFRLEDRKKSKVFEINPFELDGIAEKGWGLDEMSHIENKLPKSKSAIYWNQNSLLKKLLSEAHPNLIKIPDVLCFSPLYTPPLDFQAVSEKQAQEKYENDIEFHEDIRNILSNCAKFYASTPDMLENVQKVRKVFEMMTSRYTLKIVK